MPNTTAQQLPYPAQGDPPNGPAQMQALALAVEPRLVQVYADASDRDNKVTAPASGMLAWLQNPGQYVSHDGSSWSAQARSRIVANRAARLAASSRVVGDIVVEGDTAMPFIWDGGAWRGLWSSIYAQAFFSGGFNIASETEMARVEIPDYGCRVTVDFTAQAIMAKTVDSDLFTMVVRNGTGQSSPALSGPILTQTAWEPGVNSIIRQASGNTGVISGAYSLQVNAGRFLGTGVGGVAIGGQNFITATVTPTWS